MASGDTLRTLKIKTSVVERTLKELSSYRKELDDNKKAIEKVLASDDHSKLKQWENVLGETEGMIPDTSNRLSQAVEDLHNFLNTSDVPHNRDVENARSTLLQAREALKA